MPFNCSDPWTAPRCTAAKLIRSVTDPDTFVPSSLCGAAGICGANINRPLCKLCLDVMQHLREGYTANVSSAVSCAAAPRPSTAYDYSPMTAPLNPLKSVQTAAVVAMQVLIRAKSNCVLVQNISALLNSTTASNPASVCHMAGEDVCKHERVVCVHVCVCGLLALWPRHILGRITHPACWNTTHIPELSASATAHVHAPCRCMPWV